MIPETSLLAYKEIAKEATKENMPELKQAYNDGMKACK